MEECGVWHYFSDKVSVVAGALSVAEAKENAREKDRAGTAAATQKASG